MNLTKNGDPLFGCWDLENGDQRHPTVVQTTYWGLSPLRIRTIIMDHEDAAEEFAQIDFDNSAGEQAQTIFVGVADQDGVVKKFEVLREYEPTFSASPFVETT